MYNVNFISLMSITLNLYGLPYISRKPIVYKPPASIYASLPLPHFDLANNLVAILYNL